MEDDMNGRPYFLITASIFCIVATVHLARLALHFPLVVGSWSAPMWISVPGLLVPGALCVWGFRLAGRRGSA
jgi:hypothetical protein